MQNVLPPYGKILQIYQYENIHLKFPIYIFVGRNARQEAYANKAHGVMSTFIPQDKSFDDFYWPIKDQKVVLFDTGSSSLLGLNRLCYKILHVGAKSVCRYSEIAPIDVFTQANLNKEKSYETR